MRFLNVFICALLLAGSASAHSSGASFEVAKHPYIIDVGYDPAAITEGDRMVLDFELWEADTSESRTPAEYTRVWTRFEHEGVTVLATGVANPPFGPTSLLFLAHSPGAWVLHVRYEREDEIIVEHSFPFEVVKKREVPILQSILIVAGVLFSVVMIFVWYRINRKRQGLP